MDLVGSGCEKTKHHLNPSPKRPKTHETRSRKLARRCLRNPLKTRKNSLQHDKSASRWKHVPKQVGPSKNQRARRNTQTSPLDHTMKEITKRHKTLETFTLERGKGRLWGLLKTTKWPQKLDYNRRANKDKNGSRRQWMRKGQTPPKSEPKTTKNATKPEAEKLAKRCLRNPLKTRKK